METRHTQRPTGIRGGALNPAATRDEIIDWLKNAYAMERGLEASLEMQSRNNELSPEARDRAMRHAQETRRHAEAVQTLLRNEGADISTIKTGIGTVTQMVKGLATAFTRDERIKDLLDSYAMEHFEIASYTALAAAAERAGMPQVVQVCHSIIPDEHRMAQAIIQTLPEEVAVYLFETETTKR